jgi:hypothetical protein
MASGLLRDPVQGGWNKHEHKTLSNERFFIPGTTSLEQARLVWPRDYFVIPFRGAGTSMNTKPFQMKGFLFQALLRSSKLGLYGLE